MDRPQDQEPKWAGKTSDDLYEKAWSHFALFLTRMNLRTLDERGGKSSPDKGNND